MILILFGAPGVGKGTIAARLHKKLKIPHISSGNMIRDLIRQDKAGRDLAHTIHQGDLIPDLLVYKIVGDRLKEKDCQNGYILDGFPRTVEQAKFLNESLEHHHLKIACVVNLTASDETVITRVTGRRICEDCNAIYHLQAVPPKKEGICDKCNGKLIQRHDDTPEVVKNRIKVYHEQTEAVIGFYQKEKMMVDVNAEQPIETVFKEACEYLSK